MKSAATSLADPGPAPQLQEPPGYIREAVRTLLLATPAFAELDPEKRRAMAQSMVRVCTVAAALLHEEMSSDREARATPDGRTQAAALWAAPQSDATGLQPASPVASRTAPDRHRPLARAQATAGQQFSGVAADRVAGTTQAILNAVSFPRFVTDLINGVFRAMIDSSRQQMQSYVELLNSVSASIEGFADTQLGQDRARAWLAERFPASFEVTGESDQEPGDPPDPDAESSVQLRLREGASMPSEEGLRAALGLGPDETVPTGDPDRVLVPLARRQLAAQRQQMLATMVMLGMQRIVVDSGRIHASMRFHIDTRSAAEAESGSRTDFSNTISAAGSFGFGPWGASASMTNNIGYVSTERNQTTEEMNTSLDLNSDVEINFRSDYLPLNRMASPGQAERIRANSINPEAEAAASEGARREQQTASEGARRQSMLDALRPPEHSGSSSQPSGEQLLRAADEARDDAARRRTGGHAGQRAERGGNRAPANPPAAGAPNSPPAAGTPASPPAGGQVTGAHS